MDSKKENTKRATAISVSDDQPAVSGSGEPSSFDRAAMQREESADSLGTQISNSRPLHHQNLTFPELLHVMLYEAETGVPPFSHIVSWLPDSRTFRVHLQNEFVEEVMPNYFQMKKYKSFLRQLNMWSFRMVQKDKAKPDYGGFSQDLFVRNRPELCKQMKRIKIRGMYKRKAKRSSETLSSQTEDVSTTSIAEVQQQAESNAGIIRLDAIFHDSVQTSATAIATSDVDTHAGNRDTRNNCISDLVQNSYATLSPVLPLSPSNAYRRGQVSLRGPRSDQDNNNNNNMNILSHPMPSIVKKADTVNRMVSVSAANRYSGYRLTFKGDKSSGAPQDGGSAPTAVRFYPSATGVAPDSRSTRSSNSLPGSPARSPAIPNEITEPSFRHFINREDQEAAPGAHDQLRASSGRSGWLPLSTEASSRMSAVTRMSPNTSPRSPSTSMFLNENNSGLESLRSQHARLAGQPQPPAWDTRATRSGSQYVNEESLKPNHGLEQPMTTVERIRRTLSAEGKIDSSGGAGEVTVMNAQDMKYIMLGMQMGAITGGESDEEQSGLAAFSFEEKTSTGGDRSSHIAQIPTKDPPSVDE